MEEFSPSKVILTLEILQKKKTKKSFLKKYSNEQFLITFKLNPEKKISTMLVVEYQNIFSFHTKTSNVDTKKHQARIYRFG